MVDPYRLFVYHATLEVYQMPKPILALCPLGIIPFFSSFLSNLLDTIALPTKCILSRHLLPYNQPSLDQQLFFQTNYEHFHFLSADPCYHDDMHLEHG